MLDNEEIKSIIASLGVGIQKDNIDLEKLRYHKIIIATDADVDGGHICSLLLTFFYKYLKSIVEQGYLYVALPPLFKVNMANKDYYFLNDLELNEFVSDKKNYTIQRFKGLGEMSCQQLSDTILNESSRTLIQIKIYDFEDTTRLFDVLMGNAIEERKKYIIDNAAGFEVNI
jgi:DNA gyrase subunit B